MKKATKAALLICCVVLLVAGSVMGTLAYLTSVDSVTNTFTIGNVIITLDEADVTEYGKLETTVDSRVDANVYKLIPGHEYIKDPTIHVDDESEDSWLFVKVENAITALETKTEADTVAGQMTANGWTPVTGETNLYAYNAKVSAGDDVTVFETFTIDGSMTYDDIKDAATADNTNSHIKVTAYAIQADGFATAAEAWTALKTEI